jgi:POT family proton-dependent oligopeptide transporter
VPAAGTVAIFAPKTAIFRPPEAFFRLAGARGRWDGPPPMSPTSDPSADKQWFGHPRGLSTLFFSEMWERFSYYGMRALLVIFLSSSTEIGGAGMSVERANLIYAMYTSMVYLAGVPGGWLADKFLGLRNAVLYGGILIMAGHICLAMPSMSIFYLGLALIVLGTGLLKPCISTLVGKLYAPEDIRRDSGFSIYYMGINIGALIAPLACGYLAQDPSFREFLTGIGLSSRGSWHFGFAAAAVGMGLGLVQYVIGWRHLGRAGERPAPASDPDEAQANRFKLAGILFAIFGVPALLAIASMAGVLEITQDRLHSWNGWLLGALVVGVFGGLFVSKRFSREERKRLLVVFLLFFGSAVFFACFEQAGSTMSTFADKNTRNAIFGWEFPSSYWQSVNALFVIVLAPIFAWVWLRLAKRDRDPSAPTKFGIGMVLAALSFLWLVPAGREIVAGGPTTLVGAHWLLGLYFVQTMAEMCVSPVGLSSMTKLAPASIGGMVMGIWFLGSSCGNYMAGTVGSFYEKIPLDRIFVYVAIAPAVAALIFFVLVGPIRRMLAVTRA